MGTQATPNPAGSEVLNPQQTIYDLNTMEEVTCIKSVEFKPVTDTKEALERLNNDAAKFLDIVNKGLRAEVFNSAKADPSIPWMVKDEDGKLVPFTGTEADQDAVNSLVLSLAKSTFGYPGKDGPLEKKQAAKKAALDFIRSTEVIREGLKNSAAAKKATEAEAV